MIIIFGIVCGIVGVIIGWNYGKIELLQKMAKTKEISLETFKNEMKKLL